MKKDRLTGRFVGVFHWYLPGRSAFPTSLKESSSDGAYNYLFLSSEPQPPLCTWKSAMFTSYPKSAKSCGYENLF